MVAWDLAHGPIPERQFVKPRCGNRPCCNAAALGLSLNSIDDPDVSTRSR
ncbi:HNH endonuclease family protein [Limnoglobus roseus]|nr:hypothetical protein [Limnoglobus roseus]